MPHYFVFDVESVGLHGEGFAVGAVILDPTGKEVDSLFLVCPLNETTGGDKEDRVWVRENVIPALCAFPGRLFDNPNALREEFWACWGGAQFLYGDIRMVTDCGWPVEANFLSACITDEPSRKWDGPYPLLDVSSFLAAAGRDPLAEYPRLENELPKHNPLADARQSGRILFECLRETVPSVSRVSLP